MANRLRLCSEPAEIARAATMMYQIEVTTHCNFECFYCAGRAMPQRHMPWDLFKSIIDGIPSGQHMVSLQGEGEPTTHPKFREMAEAVSARSLVPFTITNGAQIDADWMASTFPSIGVSIDTLDAAEAERIGRHKLDRVLKNLEALDARMGPKRIRIMSVNYGQSLDAVREFVRARGYRHSVQSLQTKPDYAHRYPAAFDAPPPRYTYRCRYLERPLKRYYDIEGREYPCCFIKDARLHEPIAAMQEKMAAGEIPPACTGCREVLTAGSLPIPRLAAVARSATDVTDTGDAVPELSIITTCKGRLAHLKQTLPAMVAQADTEVIVVDYACPEGTADWVAATFPQVRVVRIERAPFFNVARARNLGAAQAHGRWLCFVDADILLAADFAVRVRPLLQNDAFHVFANPQPAVLGAVVCRPADFTAIGGYDDVIEGYGTEDRDLYLRLLAHGRRSERLPGDIVRALSHDRAASVRYYELKDHTLSQRINATYVQIKQDLARQFGAHFLGVDTRRTIYAEVGRAFRQAAASGRPATRVEITLPAALDVRLFDWQMTRVWTYLLNPLPPPLRVPEE